MPSQSQTEESKEQIFPSSNKANIFQDNRGLLHSLKSFDFPAKEILVSHSHVGVIRGLHYSPYRKHVYVVHGKIHDFWFQPSTGQFFEGILGAGDSITVPKDAMHGFYAAEEVDMLYFLEENFNPQFDKSYYWLSPGLPLKYDFPKQNLIISAKDEAAPYFYQCDYLLLGSTGYLGSYTKQMLKSQGKSFYPSSERLENMAAIENLIKKTGCKFVICAAGISGRPTTQWCEDHEKETFQVNYLQMINLMELTDRLKVHLTIYGTGMLYSIKPDKTVFDETDTPNLDNMVYVRLRVEMESHLRLYPHVLCLRILYPTTADGHPKCFLSKMKERTSSVHNTSIAVTVVPDLFPLIPQLIESNTTGPLNFVNSGTITLSEFLTTFNVAHTTANNEYKPGVELSTERLSKSSARLTPTAKEALETLAK